ncbi:GNAT family N-acetyltransferase [uncultured Tolumonas sp.]|jgi:ribosomal protein S18 acetylase RimI-like enzyme|uniref:GNAT family N-acetyltransferase n=1 Tax=uncultured Tolumonas sp. TaxID=263765 RepID=UPI002A0A6E13|nr:GNAT family N-acetyltransferase [uncultured Tolumonas sp.]
MELTWRFVSDDLDWHALAAMYRAAPLGNKTADGLKIAFNNSMFKCFVYDADNLVAAGRALADGVDCSYICDVAVLPEYQGLHIGKEIVSRLISLSAGHKKIILYAVPGKEPFYQKLGFKPMTTAMAIFENEANAVAQGYIISNE